MLQVTYALWAASNQCSFAWIEGAVAEQQGSWLDTNIGNYYCGRGVSILLVS